ncbi:MAG: hypothetical protein AAGE59_25630 [Cyanobacteria bacterium P01_F01_bin.86]
MFRNGDTAVGWQRDPSPNISRIARLLSLTMVRIGDRPQTMPN